MRLTLVDYFPAFSLALLVIAAILYIRSETTETFNSRAAELEAEISILNGQVAGSADILKIIDSHRNETDFMLALATASKRDYVRGQYDCSEMTVDSRKALEAIGYETYTIHGKYRYENGTLAPHAWGIIIVPYEATSGKLISPEVYARRYVELNRSGGYEIL